MAFDWTKSGRVEWMEFRKVSVGCSDVAAAKDGEMLENVTGWSLSWGYETDLKVSGSVDVLGCTLEEMNNFLLRVYLCARHPETGEEARVLLATCWALCNSGHYESGQYSGTIELKSTLCRHIDDQWSTAYSFNKGTTYAAHWRKIFKERGGWPLWDKALKDKKVSTTTAIEFGQASPWRILQEIADGVGGRVTTDAQGRTVMEKYTAPSGKSATVTIKTGAASVLLPGVDIDDSTAETPNRAATVLTYTVNKKGGSVTKTKHGEAKAASTSDYSYQKTGRWITATYPINKGTRTNKACKEHSAKKLKGLSKKAVYYTVKSFYLPISTGDVVNVRLDDGIAAKCLVHSIDRTGKTEDGGACIQTTKFKRLKGL